MVVLDALWSAFSTNMIVGRDGAGTLTLLAAVASLITAGFMATIGRRMMRRSYLLAVLAGCVFLPLLMNGTALLLARHHPHGTDGGGMLVGITLILSVCVLPITLATSVLYVVMARKRWA